MWSRKTVFAALVLLVLATFFPSRGEGRVALQGAATIKEISLKDLDLPPVPPTASHSKPTKITSAEELAKAFPDKDTQKYILKNVDFMKHYLLYFRWSGSGGDQITAIAAGMNVTFNYKAGFTDDIRHHAKLFVLDKAATWKVTPS